MDFFQTRAGETYCEDIALRTLAEQYGTPLYVYSEATLRRHCQEFRKAFDEHQALACFAVKANSCHGFLKVVFAEGLGADVVSVGELERSLAAGARAEQIVYSGVGKRPDEIRRALDAGILSFNVESRFELDHIESIAADSGKRAPVALRINPNIDAGTNPKIATGLHTSKFGISEIEARDILRDFDKWQHLELVGLSCHIGSQIVSLPPLAAAGAQMAQMATLAKKLGHSLNFVDMGGGLGIRYGGESPPSLSAYADAVCKPFAALNLKIVLEPGRVIAGNTGVMLTRVIGTKHTPEKAFVIVDGAMNDLMRPALYGSHHEILPVVPTQQDQVSFLADVVGPICETGDILGSERMVPRLEDGDLLYIRGCGAYGATMASQYNSRPRPAEVMVSGSEHRLLRRRETLADITTCEVTD